MRAYRVLPLALTLLATSLPALSEQFSASPSINPYSQIAMFDHLTKEIVPSDLSGSDVTAIFSTVRNINTQQEKDKSTIADLTSKVRDLENQNKDLKRSQDDLSRKLDDLSRKIK